MPRPARTSPSESTRSAPPRGRAWIAAALAPFAAGWLASGSCTVSACYEECDPCFQSCRCTSACHENLHAGSGPVIRAHRSRVAVNSTDRFVRELEVLDGARMPTDPEMPESRLVEFARAVLAANASLFSAHSAPHWTLEAVQATECARGVTFSLVDDPRRANAVTLWFDEHGRLLATTQVVERRPS